jgi:hypothetical protein
MSTRTANVSPAAGAAPAATEGSSFDFVPKIKDFMGGTVIRTIAEMYNLMPDSILFGCFVLYFLTQNLAYGVFSAFIIELTISHRLIAWMSVQMFGPPATPKPIACRAGYKTPQMDISRMFNHDPYPSYGIFSIVSMASYLGFATNASSTALDSMGENWKTRAIVAYTFMGLIVGTFILTRIFLSGCDDTLGEIIIAAVLAVIVGYIFFYINRSLFGMESMNFLGLPVLVSKGSKSNGDPTEIYVCASV